MCTVSVDPPQLTEWHHSQEVHPNDLRVKAPRPTSRVMGMKHEKGWDQRSAFPMFPRPCLSVLDPGCAFAL